MLKVIHISDTHQRHPEVVLPDADIIIHSGDFTSMGSQYEVERFFDWWTKIPITHKVLVAGNHDTCFDRGKYPDMRRPEWLDKLLRNYLSLQNIHFYLEHSSCNIWGINIFGSPYAPKIKDGEKTKFAFSYDRSDASAHWVDIPKEVDILVTHAAPYGKLDRAKAFGHLKGGHIGCESLRYFVEQRKPKLHAFGHVHEAYGLAVDNNTLYSNASGINSENLMIMRRPYVFEIDGETKEVTVINEEEYA